MKRGFYICSKSDERIEELDSYDHVCDKWKYWGHSDWEGEANRCCRSCEFAKWRH